MAPDPRAERRLDAWLLAALYLLLVGFAFVSWGKWPLVTADSARELYVPFQVHRGALIYRDFYYLYGPLAPYLNAGLLAAFGERLEVLYLAGLANLALVMGLLYALARQLMRPWYAAAAVFLFLTHFALGRDIAGYVWPYSFAATYGVSLGLTALFGLVRYTRTGGLAWLITAGLAIGASLITKLEYGFAAAMLGAIFLGARLLLAGRIAASRPWWQEALALVGPAAALAGTVAALVLTRVSLPVVLESVWPVQLMKLWGSTGTWHGSLASWALNLKWAVLDGAAIALLAGHARVLAALRRSWLARGLAAAVLAGLVAWGLASPASVSYYLHDARHDWMAPGFLLLFGVIAFALWRIARAVRAGTPVPPEALMWGLIASYGCLVAFRTLMQGLNPYLRYQAPVAMLAWVGVTAVWLPDWLERRGWGKAGAMRACLALPVIGLGSHHLAAHWQDYTAPHVAVASPVGTVLARPALGEPFNQALGYVKARLAPGDTLVAVPMEASFYLFSGRENVLKENQPFYGYFADAATQAEALRRMRERRVKYVLVSNYGRFMGQQFGETFATDIGRWLETDCRLEQAFGSDDFRIRIYRTPY